MRWADYPVEERLVIAFTMIAVAFVLLVSSVAGIWFLVNERDEIFERILGQASIVASRAEAAVVFRDVEALAEDLQSLGQADFVEFAGFFDGRGTRLAYLGEIDGKASKRQFALDARGNATDAVGFSIRREVFQRGEKVGELWVHGGFGQLYGQFAVVATLILGVAVVALFAAQRVFRRIVKTVSDPLVALVELTKNVSTESGKHARAKVHGNDEVGRLAAAFNDMLDRLAIREQDLVSSRDQLRNLYSRLHRAREDERKRLAHAIHDELGQQLAALKLIVSRCDSGTDHFPDTAKQAQLAALKEIDDTVKLVRALAWDLRPWILDTHGLVAALEVLAKDFSQRAGIRCQTHVPETVPPVPDELLVDLFRTCQELLTNALKYAKATRVVVTLGCQDGIVLSVSDNGVGFPPGPVRPDALGLLGIRERAQRWGGSLIIEPGTGGRGSLTTLSIPAVELQRLSNEENTDC